MQEWLSANFISGSSHEPNAFLHLNQPIFFSAASLKKLIYLVPWYSCVMQDVLEMQVVWLLGLHECEPFNII
jgi:hypothetical protein